jgi:hypothetical protein
MIFTNGTRVTKTQQNPLDYLASPAMSFSNKYRANIQFREMELQKEAAAAAAKTNSPEPPKKKSMKWGEPTWFMFHTLAEKIKPEYFSTVRQELLQVVQSVCSNLPCPDCARHAKQYMNGVNFNAIRTKDDLRILFHRFHNEVNQKKGFPLFPFDQLSEKYSKANTVNIIHYFMMHFEDKHKSLRMIADDLHRARICSQLRAWFSKNIGYFDL